MPGDYTQADKLWLCQTIKAILLLMSKDIEIF